MTRPAVPLVAQGGHRDRHAPVRVLRLPDPPTTALRDTLTAVYDRATSQAASDRAFSKSGFIL
ncbi:hypothetical protein MHK71_07820 [Kocuria indica]|uniref:hypothetical protein n=1 Tax=Kocuria marina TaxID=223184 RepID=UPI001EF67D0B|nr:hypothetical protein [Kocuria indica]MCG7432410.1 hypothetical protein [Kocuria indica]